MVQMAFFLRFKSQLQRIRPEIIPRLEDIVVRSVEEAGGKITGERGLIQAVFDEHSLGFWLDMLLLIETVTQALEKAALDLNGYSLVLGKVLPDIPIPLCRFLSGGGGGFFLDKTVSEAMSPYVTVEEQGRWPAAARKYGLESCFRLKEIKIIVPMNKPNGQPDPEQRPGVLFASQSFEGKRDKLYLRVAGSVNSYEEGGFAPLFVRFGSGSLNALIDSWADWNSLSLSEGTEAARDFLFRQRLKNKPSPFAVRTARRFFKMLLSQYRSLAQTKNKIPVIILENIQNAEQTAAEIVIESLRGRHYFLLLGTCTGDLNDEGIAFWKPLFPQLTRINTEETANQELPDIPLDLWETGFACLLFGRFFPPYMLPRLFEEAGKSSAMIAHALSLLYSFRIIDTPFDPRPWHKQFHDRAENALGERKDRIHAMVRSRLLAWEAQRKITPCLRLLEILKELSSQEEIDDSLILRAIHGELSGVDVRALEDIHYNEILETTAKSRAPILRYIMETLIALHSGEIKNIHTAFASQPPDSSAFPLLKAQALLNQSLYYMGLRDDASTLEAVKEASLLCQGKGGSDSLAQAYRLFALASLLRRQVGETIDYLSFSLENAAKSGSFQDIGMAAYYAASVQMLYGNLSRAKILAEKARRHFLRAGSPEWADRSRFLLGRLAFELGSYQQAIDIFENIGKNPDGASFPEKNATLAAWAYRAKMCSSSSPYPKPQSGGKDAGLFEIEALCLASNHAQAVELSGVYVSSSGGDDFLCIERPDWRSGFAQCELLYCAWNDLRDRMLSAYHSLAQSGLSTAGSEEIIRTMQRVLRGGQFPEIDPCDVFFHYVWYRVLEQTGASQVDISTAVSVAFKRLQSRAARIDDMDIRHQYLTQPRWNKAIELAAREYKLV